MASATLSTVTLGAPISTTRAVDVGANASYVTFKGSAGVLDRLIIDNSAGAAAVCCQLWDAAAPTVGTDAPWLAWTVAAGDKVTLSGRNLTSNTGIAFGTALTCAVTTAVGGSTNPPHTVKVEAFLT